MKYYNLCLYERNGLLSHNNCIDVDGEGRITSIEYCKDINPEKDKDCHGLVAIPSFVDSCVTLPGKDIFKLFGLDLSGCNTMEGYLSALSSYHIDDGIRAYGVNTFILGDNGAARIKNILDTLCKDKPAYVYIDDMTNVIVNNYILEEAKSYFTVDRATMKDGLLDMFQISLLKSYTSVFDFTRDNLRIGLLSFQATLFEKGITHVRVLNVYGSENTLEAISDLINNGMWLLHTILYVPLYPFDTYEEQRERFELYKSYESELLHVTGVTVTLDGSIDSGQAALVKPYEVDKDWNGEIYWGLNKLRSTVEGFILNGWDVNISAYGDRATSIAVDVFSTVKAKVGTGRKIITHAYLMSDMDIRACCEKDITVCVEPVAVPYMNSFYEGDSVMLGDRVYTQYPVGRLMYSGVNVIAGSNTPTQPDISPINGVYRASHRSGVDDATPYQLIIAYGETPYKLFGLWNDYGELIPGKYATFTLIDKDVINMREDLLCDCNYVGTVVRGQLVWLNEEVMNDILSKNL